MMLSGFSSRLYCIRHLTKLLRSCNISLTAKLSENTNKDQSNELVDGVSLVNNVEGVHVNEGSIENNVKSVVEITHALATSSARLRTKLNAVELQQLDRLQEEYLSFRLQDIEVPDDLSEYLWINLLRDGHSEVKRKQIYSYFIKKKLLDEEDRAIKLERRAQLQRRLEDNDKPNEMLNRVLPYCSERARRSHTLNNVAHSAVFGPRIVFDMGFLGTHRMQEVVDMRGQLNYAHGVNRRLAEPFYTYYCNVDKQHYLFELLSEGLNNPLSAHSPYVVTEKCFTDIFHKETLVYLSPNSPYEMTEFNYDDVYIIGGIVDLNMKNPQTLAKSKKMGLRTVHLPLKRLPNFTGQKLLTLDQVWLILAEMYAHQDWDRALQHVPLRKMRKQQSRRRREDTDDGDSNVSVSSL